MNSIPRFQLPSPKPIFHEGETRTLDLGGEDIKLGKDGKALTFTVPNCRVELVFDETWEHFRVTEIYVDGVRVDDDPLFITIKAGIEIYVERMDVREFV